MAANPTDPDRERLHRLVDRLPEGEVPAAEAFPRERAVGHDQSRHALAEEPEDDGSLTSEERAEIDEGLLAIARGDVVSHEELRRSLGL